MGRVYGQRGAPGSVVRGRARGPAAAPGHGDAGRTCRGPPGDRVREYVVPQVPEVSPGVSEDLGGWGQTPCPVPVPPPAAFLIPFVMSSMTVSFGALTLTSNPDRTTTIRSWLAGDGKASDWT